VTPLLLLQAARAQDPGCAEALHEHELRAMVKRSTEALFDDKPQGHNLVYEELAARIGCLDHQLPKDAWAQLSLNEAIVRYVSREDWQPILSRALEIFPDLEDVPDYLLREWVRPPAPRYNRLPVPPDATLFVDGVLTARVWELTGEHVVQVWRDGRWSSALLRPGDPFPEAWLAPRPKEILTVEATDERWQPSGRGGLGLGFGVWVSNQMVEDIGNYLPDASAVGGSSILGAHGAQPIAGSGGIFYDGTLRIVAPSVRRVAGTPTFDGSPEVLPAGYAGPAGVFEHNHVGIGFGGFALQTIEGGEVLTRFFPQPHLSVGNRAGRASFEFGGGLSPSAAHGTLRAGWVLTGAEEASERTSPLDLQFGVDSNLDLAWFSEAPPGDRRASVLQVSIAGRIDLAWGADR
jgi:hypothetical protein